MEKLRAPLPGEAAEGLEVQGQDLRGLLLLGKPQGLEEPLHPQGEARGLVLVDGVVTALLGGLLVAEWPSDSLWAVGTLFGISLFFTAFRLITSSDSPQA